MPAWQVLWTKSFRHSKLIWINMDSSYLVYGLIVGACLPVK